MTRVGISPNEIKKGTDSRKENRLKGGKTGRERVKLKV